MSEVTKTTAKRLAETKGYEAIFGKGTRAQFFKKEAAPTAVPGGG